MAYPRNRRSRAHKFKMGTIGTYAVSGTSWSNLDTATDIVLPAQVGDTIRVEGGWQYQNEAEYAFMDVATIVSSAVVNTFSTQGAESGSSQGISSWFGTASRDHVVGGSWMYTLVASDISTGTVTLRLRKRANGAGTKNIPVSAAKPFQWSAENLGPPAPY